ncbi:hypothetical protein ACNOYE_23185 [Nannocystaceae bacterium ST9]
MRFDSLTLSSLFLTSSLALACSDDGKSGDEAGTSESTDGSTGAETDGDETSVEPETTAETAETTETATDTSTETTQGETTETTETSQGETTETTGALGCAEIEAEYAAQVAMTTCADDSECKIISGHCSVGLGGCDYAVNVGVDEALLDQLAQEWSDGGCTNGVCDCAPPPASAMCSNGTCVGVN